jgi:hypothetical protein
MNENEHGIARQILEELYNAWERQTKISFDNVKDQGGWNRSDFRAVLYKLEKQQGLIVNSGAPYGFEITPAGITYAEENVIALIDKAEQHKKIRQHVLAFLADLYERNGVEAEAHYEKIVESIPVENRREILVNLLLLTDMGDIQEVSINTFRITGKGLKRYHSTKVEQQDEQAESLKLDSYSADVLIVWDPEAVDKDDYASLITALGDLVRSEGGIGVERIGHLGFGIPVSESTLV